VQPRRTTGENPCDCLTGKLTGFETGRRNWAMKKAVFSMMETVQTTETLVNLHQSTRRDNPEDSHLHTHLHENLKA
jgi:hypothetical protein